MAGTILTALSELLNMLPTWLPETVRSTETPSPRKLADLSCVAGASQVSRWRSFAIASPIVPFRDCLSKANKESRLLALIVPNFAHRAYCTCNLQHNMENHATVDANVMMTLAAYVLPLPSLRLQLSGRLSLNLRSYSLVSAPFSETNAYHAAIPFGTAEAELVSATVTIVEAKRNDSPHHACTSLSSPCPRATPPPQLHADVRMDSVGGLIIAHNNSEQSCVIDMLNINYSLHWNEVRLPIPLTTGLSVPLVGA